MARQLQLTQLQQTTNQNHLMRRRHWAVGWLSALLLAWLFSLIVVEPVAAQTSITPSTPCTTSTNLTNLSAGGSRGITNQPVISGDGRRVAFWSVNNLGGRNVDGNIEVFVGETSSSSITQLTDSVGSILGGFNLEPSINTAGTHIAFYSDRDLVPGQNPDGNFEIFLARRASNGNWSITQITNTEGSANLFPSINAAGDRIAFVSDDSELHNIDNSRVNADRNFEIFLATIPSNGAVQIRQITNTGAGVTNDQPAINGAGDRIAFTASTGQSAQVFVWDAAFGAPTQLTQADANDQASISADGTSIVYIATGSDDRSRVVLHTLSLDGTESRAEVIVPSATNTKYRSPSISGNGERVVYVAEQGAGTAIQINVLLYDVNTGLGVPISEVGGGTGEQPAISRDGTRVTFVGVQAVGGSTDNAGSDIYINECPQADLVLDFVQPPATSVLAGIDVFYQFQVTNRGPSVANGAYFRSDLSALPALPNGVSRLLPSGCNVDANDILTCSLGNIAINATRAFTMGYQIPSNAALGNIVTQIEVGANSVDPDLSNNSKGPFTTRVFEESALRLAVTASPSTILAGSTQELTYELRVTNDGPSQARSTQITNTLPNGSTFVSVQLVSGGGSGATCTPPTGGSRVVTCGLGNLTAGSTAVVRIRVTARADSPATWSNVATVRSLTNETNLSDNTITTDTPIERSADMVITKTTPNASVVAGREITYTIRITNTGFSDTSNARIVDTLPTNVSYARSVFPALPGGSCTVSGQAVTCNFTGALTVGATRIVQIVGLVSSTAPVGTISNVATVSSDRSDPNLANNTTPGVTTTVIRLADLGVTKTVNSPTPDIRSTVIYTVTVRNNGPSQATSVVMTDILPSNLTFISANATLGSYNNTSGLWSVGNLNVNQEQRLVIRATILDAAGGNLLTNTATVGGAQAEPAGSTLPNTASVNITPQSANLAVGISSTPLATAGVTAGERLTYTLRITNTGPTMARSVRLTDTLPSNVFFVSATSPCSHTSGVVTCNVGNMNAGVNVNYTVVITRALKGSITNNIAAYSLTPDVNLANNTASHTITVNPAAPDRLFFSQQPPSSVTAGISFSPAPKVEIRDRFNNLIDVGTGSTGTVRLRAYTNATCTTLATPDVNDGEVVAVGGVATFSDVDYTRAGTIYLRAEGVSPLSVSTACSTAVLVNPDVAAKLVITTAAQTGLIAGRISDVLTVQRRDQYENPTTVGALTVVLTDTSTSGYFVNSNTTPINTITTVQIPNGSSSANFYYTDTTAGSYTLHVSASGVTPASQPITVVAGPASALLVVLSAPTTVTAGVQSDNITIARIDDFGNENSTDATLTVLLSSDSPQISNYKFYSDTTVITRTLIALGTSRATFSYSDIRAGLRTLTFADENGLLDPATMNITVVPSTTYQLVFDTAPKSVTAGQTSSEIRVAREDIYGNRNFADPNTTVVVASSSISNPTFSPSTTLTILQGNDSTGFTYSDRLAGTHVITASSSGLQPASQNITITAAAATRLQFLSPSYVITAGIPSDVIIVERQDQFGNGRTDPALVVTLSSTSVGTTAFLDQTGTTTLPGGNQLTIAAGQSQARFTYRDTLAGTPILTVANPSLANDSQTHTVVPGVLDELLWSPISAQTNNVPFTDGTITARDAYENIILDFDGHANPVTLSVTNRPTATVTLSDNNNVLEPSNFVNGVADLAAQGLTYRGLAGNVIFQAMAGSVVNTTTVSIGVGALDRVVLDGPSTATAGVVFTVTLTGLDVSGNLVSGVQTVSFAGAVAALDGTTPYVIYNSNVYNFGQNFSVNFVNGIANAIVFLPNAVTTDLTSTVSSIESNELEVDVLASETLAELLWQVSGPQGNQIPFTNGTITARDQYSNTILNFDQLSNPVTLSVTNRPTATLTLSDNNNILEPGNFVNGVADLAVHELTYSGLAGDVIFRATAGAVIGETTVNIIVGALNSVELTGPSSTTANTPFNVVLIGRDSTGNPIMDSTHIISITGALASPDGSIPIVNGELFGNSFSVDFVGGQVTLPMTLTNAALTELIAHIGAITSNELEVNVLAGAATNLTLSMAGGPTVAAGSSQPLAITAYDDLGNIATGYAGAKSMTFSGPLPSTRPATPATVVDNANVPQPIGTATTLSFVNGVADQTGNAADFRPTQAATDVNLSVTDGLLTSNLITFTVTPGALDKLAISPMSATVTVGQAVSLSLRVEDAFGNLISTDVLNGVGNNQPIIFSASPSATAPDGTAATVTNNSGSAIDFGVATSLNLPAGISTATGNNNGVLRIGKAGTFVVTANNSGTGTDEAKPSGALTITVLPGPLDALDFAATGPQANAVPFSNGTLTAMDAFENLIDEIDPAEFPIVVTTNAAGTVAFVDSSNDELDAADFVNGVADVSVTGAGLTYTGAVGNATFTATSQNSVADSVTILIEPGPLSSLTLGGLASTEAGSSYNPTLTAEDVSGNAISDGSYNVTFNGADHAPDGTPPTVNLSSFGTPISVSFVGGSASVAVVLPKAGATALTATLGAVTSAAHNVNVTAAAMDTLVWNVDSPQEDGEVFSNGSTLTAEDQYGNAVPDFVGPVDITEPTASGTLSMFSFTVADFVNGVVDLNAVGFSFTFTPPATSGTIVLDAAYGPDTWTINVDIIEAANVTSVDPGEDSSPAVEPEQNGPNRFYLPSIRQPGAIPTPVAPTDEESGEQASVDQSIFLPILGQ